jgi:hypothetical protein
MAALLLMLHLLQDLVPNLSEIRMYRRIWKSNVHTAACQTKRMISLRHPFNSKDEANLSDTSSLTVSWLAFSFCRS